MVVKKIAQCAVVVVMMSLSTPLFAAPADSACFHRSVGIHNMMNWAAVEKSDPKRYVFPPFRGPDYEMSDAVLRNVAAAGFDSVRVTVDPGPFLQFTGAKRDALDRHLVGVVERMLANRLCVIVDFHPNRQVSTYEAIKLVQATDDPLFLDYASAIERTARLLAGLKTNRVALELMNEPPYGWDAATTERWQRMLEILHRTARSAAPDLLLILSGAHGGDAAGLIALDPAAFANSRVLYTFHYYRPYEFTHQGVKSTGPNDWHWQFISSLPYPAHSADPNLIWEGIRLNILMESGLSPADRARALDVVHERVAGYFASDFSKKQIGADFDQVLTWANRHNIDPHAILLGEFGVTRTYGMYRASDATSREAWIRDVRTAAERRGFRWAFWALSGYGGMALVEVDDGSTLDPGSLRALGLSGGY